MSAQSKISNNGSAEHRRPSISYLYSALPSQIKPDPAAPSTNKIILDYLLYLSIQSRLQQAALELDELASPAPEEKADEPEHIERRANKWRDTASRAERDKNAVESIVAGMNPISVGFMMQKIFELKLPFLRCTVRSPQTNTIFNSDKSTTGTAITFMPID